MPGVWRVRPDPAVSLRAAARWAGIPVRFVGYAVAHAVEIGAYVFAFATLGGDALDGTVTGSTIAAFGAALALVVVARAAGVASVSASRWRAVGSSSVGCCAARCRCHPTPPGRRASAG